MTSYATDTSPIVLDIETTALPNAADYLEPIVAAKNLKDPEKVAADIAQRTAERESKLGLDWNVGRIVALGWWTRTAATFLPCLNEEAERRAIEAFWDASEHRTIVGFCCKTFDLRYLIQRSRYLDIRYPDLDLGRYGRKSAIVDLYQELTFNEGTYDQGAMKRTLKAFCRRFGIPVNDLIDGKDVPALVEAGDWEAVVAHLQADVEATVALAQRLGVVADV
jgi:predicted PolB exonuclease-like 3'-5' exonuclease